MRATAALSLSIFLCSAIVLVAAVPPLYLLAARSTRTARTAIADACGLAVDQSPGGRPLDETLASLQQKYGLESVMLDAPGDRPRRGSTERRQTRHGVLELRFSDDVVGSALRLLRFSVAGAVLAAISGATLLAVDVLTSLRSRSTGEAASAPEAMSYALRTFEGPIRSMVRREHELRQSRDQAKERAEELAMVSSTLVRSLASGFIAIDADGAVLNLNETARRLLSIPDDGLVIGRCVEEAFGPTPFGLALQNAVRERATLQRVQIAQGPAESQTIGLSTVPLTDEGGRHCGMLVLFTDLTPYRRLETRISEMQSLADLGEMSTGIAHEFRNSLSTVLGYLRLAQRESHAGPAAEHLRRAEKEALSLNEAVERLLAFSRPFVLLRQELDLRDVGAGVVEGQRALHPGIRFSCAGPAAPMFGDVALLTRAFENIVRNGIEAIEAKGQGSGTIDVRIIHDGELTRVSVEDDGVGIDESDTGRLFLPFQSNKSDGFGLGLFLVRKIILLHGGQVSLSGRKGHGACVTLEFNNNDPPIG